MQTKKILVSALVAAALIAGSGAPAAVAAPVAAHQVSTAAKVSPALQLQARKAADAANTAEYTAVLVTGYGKKLNAVAKALVSYTEKYIVKKGYELEVVTLDGKKGPLRAVAASDDTSILFELNGKIVHDGDVVNVTAGTGFVAVAVNVKDEYATYAIDGNNGLVAGDNIVTVSVTAANGEVDVLNVIVNVAE